MLVLQKSNSPLATVFFVASIRDPKWFLKASHIYQGFLLPRGSIVWQPPRTGKYTANYLPYCGLRRIFVPALYAKRTLAVKEARTSCRPTCQACCLLLPLSLAVQQSTPYFRSVGVASTNLVICAHVCVTKRTMTHLISLPTELLCEIIQHLLPQKTETITWPPPEPCYYSEPRKELPAHLQWAFNLRQAQQALYALARTCRVLAPLALEALNHHWAAALH